MTIARWVCANVKVAMRVNGVGWILRDLGDRQAKAPTDAMDVDDQVKIFSLILATLLMHVL
jgi:hypothetical protein